MAKYCYDSVGRLSAISCGDFQLRCQYDGNGRLAECLRGNGVSSRYVYNRAGLPSLLTHARGTEILEQLSYCYDPLGNPVRVERKSAEAGCSYACEYAYDQNGRLSAVRMAGDLVREYRYDGYGNRTSAAPGAPALPPCPYTPLDQPPGSSYTPNGGLSSTADGYGYRYDSLGHLTEITRGGELLQGNEYDGLGRRVRTWGEISGAFGGDIRYTIDNTGEFPHILMEQGGRERKYLWQENTLCGMPEEGRYVLTDPLGTPLVVAGPDGQVQNAYRYDEFGLSEYRREEAPLPFGFTGCLADRVDGLYYANAREYHAGSGRFLTKDLNRYMDFKDPTTLNLYQYAKGNPLKYVDPSGHESINEDYGYLFHTMNMAVGGSFTNDFTWAGLGIQLALGFLGVDIICDARDFAADVTVNRDLTSLSWWGMMALDIIAFAPAIGDVKYLDDAVYGVKMLFKNGDELVDGSRRIIKASDNLRDLSRTGGNALDGLNDMAGTALKNADMLDNARHADDVVDAASDAGKRLEDVAGGGLTPERIEYYLSRSRNNIDSDTVILGSTGKYDIIAETEGYTYFKMSDDAWASLEKEAGGNYEEIWKVNQQFIDEQIAANKNILLSNDPYMGYYFSDGAKRFYQREIDYILGKGYIFESTGDGLWKAVRK